MGLGVNSDNVRDPFKYARNALESECAELASTGHGRNGQINTCAFKLGQFIPNGYLPRHEIEHCIEAAAHASGYVQKDGIAAVRASIRSGIEGGMKQPRHLGQGEAPRATIHVLRPKPRLSGVDLPAWTEPGEDGKPKFIAIGQPEPRPFSDEVRRHVYRRDGEAVRVKTKNQEGRFSNWYRVRRPSDGAVGWQARQPEGWVDVPYVAPGAPNPFDAERRGQMVAWPEGEKDVETLAARRWLAFTFGGTSDTPDLSGLLEGHHVVILADNDEQGEKAVTKKIAAAVQAGAASIKVVRFPELPAGGDVSDFLERGGTDEDLLDRAERIDPAKWRAEREAEAGASGQAGAAPGEDGFGPSTGASPKDDPFPLIWHGEDDDAPLAEWLVEEMLPKVGTALLSGQWGTYKTFCGFDLSAAVMTGGTFAGRRVKRAGGVLWLAVEGQSEVRKRLAAVAQEKVAPAIDGGVVQLDPDRLPFVWVKACPKLSDPNALPVFRALVEKAALAMRERHGLDLALVIIDTLSPAAEMEDANDTAEAQRVMTALKRTAEHVGTVVLAVDHMGKDVSTGTRNSSVKEADVDAVLALLGEKDLAGNVANPRLAMRKVRGAPTGWEVKFDKRVVTVGTGFDQATTLVVDWATGEMQAKADKPAKPLWSTSGERALKGCLERALVDHGSEQQPYGRKGPTVRAVHLSKVRDAFMSEYAVDVDDRSKALDAKRKAFTRAREGAQRKGLVQTKEIGASLVDWIWLVQDAEADAFAEADHAD